MRPHGPAAAVLALLLLTAGCLGGPVAGDGTTPTDVPSDTPTPEPPTTTPTGTPEPTRYDHEHAANQPDADKAIKVENEWNRTVEMHVQVVREATNATVYEATHEVAPGAERTVYNTADADPDGVESFTVVATARGTTERITIETSECYGDVFVTITEDGTFYPYYAIC